MAVIRNNRSEFDILRDGTQRLSDNIGINASNSTATSRNILEITSREVSNTWDVMNTLLYNNYLTTATGEALDKLGELLQEPRSGVKRSIDLSTSNVSIELDRSFASNISDLITRYFTPNDKTELYNLGLTDSATTPTTLSFPSQLVFSTRDGDIGYTTMSTLELNNSQLIDYTPVTANGVGEAFNVGPNSLNNHNLVSSYPVLRKITNALKVKNIFAITSGSDIESDDNYRYRLSNKVVSAAGGNSTAVRRAALSVPGVVDISIIKRSHGNGTFTLFPRTEDPIVSDGILNAVKSAVDSAKSIGDIAYTMAPEYLGVSFGVQLRFAPGAPKESIYAEARLSIIDYINNLLEGGEIVINEVIQRVMAVDEKIIDMEVYQFGFGDYNRISGVITGFTPLRLVNQIADWNQRFYTNSQLVSICKFGSL